MKQKRKTVDHIQSREFLKKRKVNEAIFEKELTGLVEKKDVPGIVRCIGSAAYYGVPDAQLKLVRLLMTNCSPEIKNDLRAYLVDAAVSGLPEGQIFLSECYRSGNLFKQNEILADHLHDMAVVGFKKRDRMVP